MKRRWISIGLLLLCCGATSAMAAELAERVREHHLDNGLTLLVVERHDSPTFAAYITVGVGSVDETSENRGVAHLLEHMRFKGTKSLGTSDYAKEKPLLDAIARTGGELDRLRVAKVADPERVALLEIELKTLQDQARAFIVPEEVSRIYAESGGVNYNAYTSKDLTTYIVSLPANKLELWAAIESDRMKNPVLREFYTEREVVKEERRRSRDSDPDGILYEALTTTAFIVHPYRHPIIGWMSDLDQLTLEKTKGFLASYYAPVNTVIALVGDLDDAQALAMVERYFGKLPPGTPVPPVTAAEPEQNGERRSVVRFDAEPKVEIAFHKPTLPNREDYVFDLIQTLLSEGRTSRLYSALVVKSQLAAAVGAYGAPGARYPNLFVVSASPRAPHTVAEVEAAIWTELQRLATTPVTMAELEQVRNRLRADRVRGLRENEGLAQMLTYYQSVAGDWRYLTEYDQAVASITPEEIQIVAQRYFTPLNRTVVILDRDGGAQ